MTPKPLLLYTSHWPKCTLTLKDCKVKLTSIFKLFTLCKYVHVENMLDHHVNMCMPIFWHIILINGVVCLSVTPFKWESHYFFCDIYIIDRRRRWDRSESSGQIIDEGCSGELLCCLYHVVLILCFLSKKSCTRSYKLYTSVTEEAVSCIFWVFLIKKCTYSITIIM